MSRFEEELKAALRREEPPANFAERVLARVSKESQTAEETRLKESPHARILPFRTRLRAHLSPRLAVAAALVLMMLALGLWWAVRRDVSTVKRSVVRVNPSPAINEATKPSPNPTAAPMPQIAKAANNQDPNAKQKDKQQIQTANSKQNPLAMKPRVAEKRIQETTSVPRRRFEQTDDSLARDVAEIYAASEKRDVLNVAGDAQFVRASFGAQNDAAQHAERVQLLLRSFRNASFKGASASADLDYERRLARKLLNKNILLRRDAASRGDLPTRELLSSVEPLLIDIANLPDRPRDEDLRSIKERVQKSAIIGVLQVHLAEVALAKE